METGLNSASMQVGWCAGWLVYRLVARLVLSVPGCPGRGASPLCLSHTRWWRQIADADLITPHCYCATHVETTWHHSRYYSLDNHTGTSSALYFKDLEHLEKNKRCGHSAVCYVSCIE